MFGICETDEMGSWGILYLVCGAIAGQSMSWKSVAFQCLPNTSEVINNFLFDSKSAEEIAIDFSDFIKQWAQKDTGKALAKKRLDELLRTKSQTVSDKGYQWHLSYLTLAIMLNSLKKLDSIEEFNEIKNWAMSHKGGWKILFFAAGLLLSGDKDFKWHEYASALKAMSGENENTVKGLFHRFTPE